MAIGVELGWTRSSWRKARRGGLQPRWRRGAAMERRKQAVGEEGRSRRCCRGVVRTWCFGRRTCWGARTASRLSVDGWAAREEGCMLTRRWSSEKMLVETALTRELGRDQTVLCSWTLLPVDADGRGGELA